MIMAFPAYFWDVTVWCLYYLDFELGLELDSAEVRGVLLYNGYECGRVTFDFLL
jgi:hypothetical protein